MGLLLAIKLYLSLSDKFDLFVLTLISFNEDLRSNLTYKKLYNSNLIKLTQNKILVLYYILIYNYKKKNIYFIFSIS